MSTAPLTLRELSGLGRSPGALPESVLVLIDCQQTYREGVMQLRGIEPALHEAASLLARARQAGRPVIHIQHDAGAGSPYDIRSPVGRIAEPVAPQDGEVVITKHYPNSFVQTTLDEELKRVGARSLILAGFMTHMCVNSTARGAFNLGYEVTVVAAATATRDLPGPDGAIVPAAALQTASLAMMGDLFATIAPSVADLPA